MSIFKRMSDLVRSNVNDVIDKAEDPRKILEQTILDMIAEHKKAKLLLLETITLLKTTEKQATNYRQQGVEWESKAMAALKAGNDDLARKALAEKQKLDNMADEATQGVELQRSQTESLKSQVVELEKKIEEAKRKKEELIARYSTAEIKKKTAAGVAGTTSNPVGDASSFDTYERMVAKIENSEAEVDARKELMGSLGAGHETEQALEQLTKAASAEDALSALKAKMGAASSNGVAGAGPSTPEPVSAIDAELAALKAKLQGKG